MHVLKTDYFRFRKIAKTLTKIVKEKQAFQWTPDSFQTLKEAICNAPIFAYLQPRGRFIADTDTNNFGIGVLYQV
jgi:hypothetical protein